MTNFYMAYSVDLENFHNLIARLISIKRAALVFKVLLCGHRRSNNQLHLGPIKRVYEPVKLNKLAWYRAAGTAKVHHNPFRNAIFLFHIPYLLRATYKHVYCGTQCLKISCSSYRFFKCHVGEVCSF